MEYAHCPSFHPNQKNSDIRNVLHWYSFQTEATPVNIDGEPALKITTEAKDTYDFLVGDEIVEGRHASITVAAGDDCINIRIPDEPLRRMAELGLANDYEIHLQEPRILKLSHLFDSSAQPIVTDFLDLPLAR